MRLSVNFGVHSFVKNIVVIDSLQREYIPIEVKSSAGVNEIYNDDDDCSYDEGPTIGGEVEGYHRDAVVKR